MGKQSLYALSSGSWQNQDVCYEEGMIDLAVNLWREHGGEDKIAEESMQVTKALMAYSNDYRAALVSKGAAKEMVGVIEKNPHDRGAVDLACDSLAMLVGPYQNLHCCWGKKEDRGTYFLPFDPIAQSAATESGAVGK